MIKQMIVNYILKKIINAEDKNKLLLKIHYRRPIMLEITVNDRLGKKVRVKCNEDDTIGDLKKLVAAQTGTR